MDIRVIGAVLAASLLHASWHALVKSTGDRLVALAGMNVVSTLAAVCALPFVSRPPAIVFLIIAGSVLLHSGYKVGLASLYVRADLSQAYPLARGLTPIMAALLGLVALGEWPSRSAMVGILLVSAGLFALTREKIGRHVSLWTVLVASITGLCVAAYSVVDAYAIRLTGDWLGFTVWLVLCDGSAFLVYVFLVQGQTTVLASWKDGWGRVIASGGFGVVSFSVFLWALGRAPVGAVTALRETSVLLAAMLGALVLKETASWLRYVAAASVTAGVITIALFR